ncbi:UNVERIFIED_CONTAM: hypothetical protein FKN15_019697 [Acipenser sinensis]
MGYLMETGGCTGCSGIDLMICADVHIHCATRTVTLGEISTCDAPSDQMTADDVELEGHIACLKPPVTYADLASKAPSASLPEDEKVELLHILNQFFHLFNGFTPFSYQ